MGRWTEHSGTLVLVLSVQHRNNSRERKSSLGLFVNPAVPP